jgi:hypothetical protein
VSWTRFGDEQREVVGLGIGAELLHAGKNGLDNSIHRKVTLFRCEPLRSHRR